VVKKSLNATGQREEIKGQRQNPSHKCESMQDMGCIKIALTRKDICMDIIARSGSEPTFFGYHGLLTNFLVVLCISQVLRLILCKCVVHVKYNYDNIFHVQ
jgi:hypothetical protein